MKTPNQCLILPVKTQEQLAEAQRQLFEHGYGWKGSGFEYLDKEIGTNKHEIACIVCFSNRSVITLDNDINSPEEGYKTSVAAKELCISLLKVMRPTKKDVDEMPPEMRGQATHILKEIEAGGTGMEGCTCDLCSGCTFLIIEDTDEFIALAVKNRAAHIDRLQKPLLITA